MPLIEVDTYSVIIQRNGDVPAFTRAISLAAKNPTTAVVRAVYIYFFEGTYAAIGMQSGTYATVYMPISDFDAFYHMVQTERPLYFLWHLEAGSTFRMRTYWLSTSTERPGEGLTDAS